MTGADKLKYLHLFFFSFFLVKEGKFLDTVKNIAAKFRRIFVKGILFHTVTLWVRVQ